MNPITDSHHSMSCLKKLRPRHQLELEMDERFGRLCDSQHHTTVVAAGSNRARLVEGPPPNVRPDQVYNQENATATSAGDVGLVSSGLMPHTLLFFSAVRERHAATVTARCRERCAKCWRAGNAPPSQHCRDVLRYEEEADAITRDVLNRRQKHVHHAL